LICERTRAGREAAKVAPLADHRHVRESQTINGTVKYFIDIEFEE
jgi:hypothetical protein